MTPLAARLSVWLPVCLSVLFVVSDETKTPAKLNLLSISKLILSVEHLLRTIKVGAVFTPDFEMKTPIFPPETSNVDFSTVVLFKREKLNYNRSEVDRELPGEINCKNRSLWSVLLTGSIEVWFFAISS